MTDATIPLPRPLTPPATPPNSRWPGHVLLFAGNVEIRGSSMSTLRLAEGLRRQGVDADVVCTDATPLGRCQSQRFQLIECRHLSNPLYGRLALEYLVHQFDDDPPDLIHIQSRAALGLGRSLARRFDRPWVLTLHDYLPRREPSLLDRRRCRGLIAVSESVAADLSRRLGVGPEFVSVIPSGVACPDDLLETPILPVDRVPVIGTAGPLEAIKGFPFFLGAAARVLSELPQVQFLIAGVGPEEASLRQLARELGIHSHVTFVPNLTDFREALHAMDLFVLPSLQQGLGTIMLEAMSQGRAVIATRVGGVAQVIRDQETGLLCPPANSQRLAELMLQFLRDPERARRMGAAGRLQIREEYSINRMVEKTIDVYARAVPLATPGTSNPGLVLPATAAP